MVAVSGRRPGVSLSVWNSSPSSEPTSVTCELRYWELAGSRLLVEDWGKEAFGVGERFCAMMASPLETRNFARRGHRSDSGARAEVIGFGIVLPLRQRNNPDGVC